MMKDSPIPEEIVPSPRLAPDDEWGLYIHVPFCARRCPYCDFAVTVNRDALVRSRYLDALLRELEWSASERKRAGLGGAPRSIYCGGGTPTELSDEQLSILLNRAIELFAPDHERGSPKNGNIEITLEANPENLNAARLRHLRAMGWNRLSLGVQSLDETTLNTLGRHHDARRAREAIEAAREASWHSISLDLIFGAPGQSAASWRATLETACDWNVDHISAYSLTIEPGTAFGVLTRRGLMRPPDDDAQADLMEITASVLGQGGFERYEISNWARPGHRSWHNLNYWRGGDYEGAGCGAHGHRAGTRWWNERDARIYTRSWLENHKSEAIAPQAIAPQAAASRAGHETLTPRQRALELIALGLRCSEGVNWNAVGSLLASQGDRSWRVKCELEAVVDRLEGDQVLERAGDFVRARPEFLPLADGLARRLGSVLLD